MDLSQRAVQTNEELSSNYYLKLWPKIENFGRKPKNIQNSEV